ncbi:hypothetical protein PAPHI01_0535 [Pancytospora philotis]|nr:hypothetical protein PAPHI01_0535 [Pancytospora philotis]
MSKAVERCERTLLFSTLTFLYTAPMLSYIKDIPLAYVKYAVPFLMLTSCLSVLYAGLCLCFRGFVNSAADQKILSCSSARGCSICMRFKPERAHHCKRCKACIKKMDHHCHWLGRCINYDNLGHFVRFLLFTFLSNVMIIAINLYYILDIVLTPRRVTIPRAVVAVVSTLIAMLVSVVTGVHCYAQFRMISNNITYVELLQKANFDIRKDKYSSVYDAGLLNNLVDVLGSPAHLFLGMPSGDGMNFVKKDQPGHEELDEDSDLFESI